MTILRGTKSTIEEREAFLSIPFEKRVAISLGDHEFNSADFGLELSKEQIIEMAESEEFILTVAENGFGKRTSAYYYRITNKGEVGSKGFQGKVGKRGKDKQCDIFSEKVHFFKKEVVPEDLQENIYGIT